MATESKIEIPPSTQTRLTDWIRQRQEIQALIDATLIASREALGVPDDWLIRDVGEGFVAPPTGARPDPEAAGGAMESVRVEG